FAFFTELDDVRHPGFPVAEVAADGSCVITKHPGTGGAVTVETVTAQLLYELGPPGYLGPAVVAHFDTIALADAGPGRVAVAVELALASYPGCTLTTLPGDAAPFGVFTAGSVRQGDVAHVAVLPSGERVAIPAPHRTADPPLPPRPARPVAAPSGTTFRVPLG